MIKLYKRDGDTVDYWEAWDGDGDGMVVVHWGRLGEIGQNREIRLRNGETADAIMARESAEPAGSGFAKIDLDDHAQIVVHFKTDDEWGDTAELEKRHEVEDILNECLGWTGNGHCDGGDIGSGSINAFSYVIDPFLARDAIVAALRENDLIDGAVIAIDAEDNYEVIWPQDFEAEFSIH